MKAYATAYATLALLAPFAAISPLHAQAMVETGLGAARASTTTAPASNLNTGIAGALDKLEKILHPAEAAAPPVVPTAPAAAPSNSKLRRTTPVRRAVAKPAAVPAPVPAPTVIYEDSSGLAVGMEREEVIRRFGPPAIEAAAEPRRQLLTYVSKGASRQVEMVDGKVASIKPAVIKQAVFVLPR